MDLGQELFKGPNTGIEFRVANLLDSSDEALDDVKGKVNLLYTGAVFHLFKEDAQRRFAENIKALLATDGEVVVFGVAWRCTCAWTCSFSFRWNSICSFPSKLEGVMDWDSLVMMQRIGLCTLEAGILGPRLST